MPQSPAFAHRTIAALVALVLLAVCFASWPRRAPRALEDVSATGHAEHAQQATLASPSDAVAVRAAATAPAAAKPAAVAPHPLVTQGVEMMAGKFAGIPGERLPVRNIAREFDSLAARARAGDLVAARTLFMGLWNCQMAPGTPEEFANFLRNIEAPSSELVARAEAMLREQYRHCGGLTQVHRDTYAEWGTTLAEHGDAWAQLGYGDFVRLDPKQPALLRRVAAAREQARAYLERQLALGNALALGKLQHYYINEHLIEADYYQSYRYGWAFVMSQHHRFHARSVTILALVQAESRLTATEVDRAKREATALVAQCCEG